MDLETSSVVNLTTRGSDAYSRDVSTRCLMMAYHLAGSPDPGRLWLEGDPVPPEWAWHVNNGGHVSGWNVLFFDRLIYRRILVPKHGFPPISDDVWIDSMHLASAANMPRSLDGCAKFVKLDFDSNLKDKGRIRSITSANTNPLPPEWTISDILSGRAPVETDKKIIAAAKKAGQPCVSPKLVEDLTWLADRCRQDIVLEEALLARLPPWPRIEPWLAMPAIDRKINDRGIMLDVPLVEGLAKAAAAEMKQISRDMSKVTGEAVGAATEVEKLKRWLVGNGVELPSAFKPIPQDVLDAMDEDDFKQLEDARKGKSPWTLTKLDLMDLLAQPDIPEHCRQAISLRVEAAKSSASKFKAMLGMVSPDHYLRNAQRLGGAQQTMRWSSPKVNLYNTLRDVYGNLEEVAALHNLDVKTDHDRVVALQAQELYDAIMIGRRGNPDEIRERYQVTRRDAQGRPYTAGVMTWISRMTRRALAAPYGSLLLNGDFAQVEARITDWLAQQLDTLQAFASGEDVYKIVAAGMYHCSVDEIGKKDPRRQGGKVTKLLGGYGGGEIAVLHGARNQGMLMLPDEAKDLVTRYRAAAQDEVKWWYATDDAAAKAVTYPGYEFPVPPLNNISYIKPADIDCLFCRLPSGRFLRYWQPRLKQEYWDEEKTQPKNRLSLWGLVMKGGVAAPRPLYHTILCENVCQAIGTGDMLAVALQNMDQANIPVALHVYDSVAGAVPAEQALQLAPLFEQCMLDQPGWIKTGGQYCLPVGADVEIGARFG